MKEQKEFEEMLSNCYGYLTTIENVLTDNLEPIKETIQEFGKQKERGRENFSEKEIQTLDEIGVKLENIDRLIEEYENL